MIRAAVRAYPTLLRVGVSAVFAYRAEFLVWILTTTMPLIMLALWSAVAREAPFGRFGQDQFTAYYLATLVVRVLTSNWVAWQLDEEIRRGSLSMRLLRPLHPFVAYSADHLSAIPFRALVALPIAVLLLATTGTGQLVRDPVQIALLFPALAGAWLLMFSTMFILGTLALFVGRSLAIFQIWYAVFELFSGYLVPIELLPDGIEALARVLPFRYILGYPVEALIGLLPRHQMLRELGIQWAWVVATLILMVWLWRRGLRRFEAYGA